MNTVLTCISCGAELPASTPVESGFCPFCGVSLVDASPVLTPAPPRPDGTTVEVEKGSPPAPPRRRPPVPPARAPMETNPFSAEVEKGPALQNPFLASPGGLIHEENTPPIPTRADGVVTSIKPELGKSDAVAAPRSPEGRPAAPRPPSPRKDVVQDSPSSPAAFEPGLNTRPNVMQAPAVVPLVARATMTSPTISDAHTEFRKGRWRGPVVALLVVAAAVGLLLFVPGGEDAKNEAVVTPEKKAVIGTSNSPEIIEEPEKKEISLRPAPSAAPRPEEAPKSDLSRFADDFKSKAGSK